MKRTPVKAGTAIGAVALVIALAGCENGNGTSNADAEVETTTLRVSLPPVADSLPVFVALEEGYFEDRGLDIVTVPAANGATAVNSLISGSTEIALVSFPTLINAHAGDLPVTIGAFGIEGTEDYMAAIYVSEESPIQDVTDLIGETVATPSLNSVGDIFLSGELLDEGINPDQVNFVEIPQANMSSALDAGDVDAVFLTEPTLSAASEELDLRPIALQTGPQGLFATSRSFIEDNGDAIQSYREALAQAVEDIEADPSGVAETAMPAHTDMDAETAREMHLPLFQTEWNPEGVQEIIDVMAELGLIDESFESGELYEEF